MPRFVLLYHDCPPGYIRSSHWDLMLESGDVLETWALFQLPHGWEAARALTVVAFPSCPPLADVDTISCEHLASHRLSYLEFEGSLGGDRGNVIRIAAGEFRTVSRQDDAWMLSIESGPLAGDVQLRLQWSDYGIWLLSHIAPGPTAAPSHAAPRAR
jgi:hypothetical protein